MGVRSIRLLFTLAVIIAIGSMTEARRHHGRRGKGRRHWRRLRGPRAAHHRLGHLGPLGFGLRLIAQHRSLTAKSQKARTFALLQSNVARATGFLTSLAFNSVPAEVEGRVLGQFAASASPEDKVRHVMRPRLLQSANATATITTVVDLGKGFTTTINNFPAPRNGTPNQPSGLYSMHQAYDLRPPTSNQTNSGNISASLAFQPGGGLVPNQLTILLSGAVNQVTLGFSKSCVFPVAASSPSLAGVNSTSGRVNPQIAPTWLSIFAPNAFEVFAADSGFGKLNSGVQGNVSVSYPQMSKAAGEAQGLYSQTLTFNTTQNMRLLQIYCPIVDSPDGSWAVNITGSPVITPVVVPPAANTTNATGRTNGTNGTNSTNGTNTTNATNGSLGQGNSTSNSSNSSNNGVVDPSSNGAPSNSTNPDSNSRDSDRTSYNKTALIVGVVLGSLLLIAIVVIIVLCVKLSKKRQEIITDEGYGPNAGFKRFDDERKVANGPANLEIPTSNALPDSQVTGLGHGDTGVAWRQNDTIVVAEDAVDRENPFGIPAKPFA